MKKAVLMGDVSVLSRHQVRDAVLRIPEVGLKIREIQTSIDTWCENPVDLFWLMRLDDVTFARLGNLRGVLVAAVQSGLYERYIKRAGLPTMIVGPKGSLPLLRAFAGQIQLNEILEKIFVENTPVNIATMVQPQSQGEFDALKIGPTGTEVLDLAAINLEELANILVEDFYITEIVNVGPGEMISRHSFDPTLERLRVSESIEIDPMLGWFWPSTQDLAI